MNEINVCFIVDPDSAYGGAPHHVTMSRIAYFKRKYVEDDDLPLNFRSYRHTVS